MSSMFQGLIYVILAGIASAVVIDHSPFYKEAHQTEEGGWKTIKTYHPPRTQRVYNNYDTYVSTFFLNTYETSYLIIDIKLCFPSVASFYALNFNKK